MFCSKDSICDNLKINLYIKNNLCLFWTVCAYSEQSAPILDSLLLFWTVCAYSGQCSYSGQSAPILDSLLLFWTVSAYSGQSAPILDSLIRYMQQLLHNKILLCVCSIEQALLPHVFLFWPVNLYEELIRVICVLF